MKFCPECGTLFEQNARFCMECGFDKSTVKLLDPALTLPPEIAVKATIQEPEIPKKVTELHAETSYKCPECAHILEPDERYCQKCGYDTIVTKVPVNANFKTLSLPDEIFRPEPVYFHPTTEKVQLPEPVQPSEPVIPQPSQPVRTHVPYISNTTQQTPKPAEQTQPFIEPIPESNHPSAVPPVRVSQPALPKKIKKTGLRIFFIIILIALLVVAAWLGYNAYMDNQDLTHSASIPNMELPPIQEAEPVAPKTEVTETPTEKAPEQPKESTYAKSKIDKELARQKTKEQKKPAQQVVAPAQKTNPDLIEKALANSTANNKQTKVIYEVGRNEEAKSKFPKNPTKLIIKQPTMIIRITTDHYNKGMGTSGGGKISIKDSKGNVVGTFTAYGKPGKNGTPDAKWVSEPHKLLQEGTYFISDSDMPTWSKTFWGTGFVIVEGYETE